MIAIILLLCLGLYLVFDFALGTLLFWCVAVAIVHAFEETAGALWEYFAKVTGNELVGNLTWLGLPLVVLPALGLQVTAALLSFGGPDINVFWVSVLIGARIGDAVLSHLLPWGSGNGISPGQSSAVVYLVDGLVMLVLFHGPLFADPAVAWQGVGLGAGFFAVVLPALKLTRRWCQIDRFSDA